METSLRPLAFTTSSSTGQRRSKTLSSQRIPSEDPLAAPETVGPSRTTTPRSRPRQGPPKRDTTVWFHWRTAWAVPSATVAAATPVTASSASHNTCRPLRHLAQPLAPTSRPFTRSPTLRSAKIAAMGLPRRPLKILDTIRVSFWTRIHTLAP